jgi:hypothetical protein
MREVTEPNRVEETGDWRKMQNEELHTPKGRFTGNMVHVTKTGNEYRILVGKYEQYIWKKLGTDGRTMLKQTAMKQDGRL